MPEKISDLIGEDFGFWGTYGGPEYDSFPYWKQAVADALLAQGMSYRIAKINLDTACEKTLKFAKEVKKFGRREQNYIPLWAKPGDIEGLLLVFQSLRAEIELLIKVYEAGE